MRLEWIEDTLAIIRTGSLNRAAEQRHLSQPAFSRRIRSIEDYVGIELLDRSRKPAQLRPSILEQQERLECIAAQTRDLLYDLRQHERRGAARLVIVSQHAITTTTAPPLIERLSAEMDVNVHLRSANRDECFSLLVRRQADVMIAYQGQNELSERQTPFLEHRSLGMEAFVPVFAAGALSTLDEHRNRGELPVILYPSDVFFGQVMNRDLLPELRSKFYLKVRAETALTLAALQLAIAGIGVAWVPISLAQRELRLGSLAELGHSLSGTTLSMQAIRLAGPKSASEQQVWDILGSLAR